VRLAKHLVVTMAAILLTGCGSPSYQDSLKASVAGMRDAITSYNGSASVDVHSSGSDCAKARDALQNTPPPGGAGPESQGQLSTSIREAYSSALKGFSDCARAGEKDDYLLMAQADQELAQANIYLDQARRLDH